MDHHDTAPRQRSVRGRMPDVVTHNAEVVSACEKGPEAGRDLEGLQAMRTRGRMPDVIIHNAEFISACEKSPEA